MKLIVSLLLAATVSAPAFAALDGARLYAEKTCNACHGADARKPLLPTYPMLAGQNAAYAEQQMNVRGTWAVHSAKRIAGPQTLSGRDRLVEALRARGFQLK